MMLFFSDSSVPGIDVVSVEAKSDSDNGPIQHQGFLPISTSAAISPSTSFHLHYMITYIYIHYVIGQFLINAIFQSHNI